MSGVISAHHRLVWSASLLAKAELKAAAESGKTYQLEHLPALISDRSVKSSPEQVQNYAMARLAHGHAPLVETIPMPRTIAGDRPIQYLDVTTRVAYNALVTMLAPSLDSTSRSMAARQKFAQFGTNPAPGHYVVISDVAACYEYIVPDLLADEVLLRTDDHTVSQALREMLATLAVRDRGVPQMMDASDRLVDLYLAKVDRTLDRAGLSFARTADDYKIDVEGWLDANRALELLEGATRDIGLTLAADKTRIVSSGKRATKLPSGNYTGDEDVAAADEENDYNEHYEYLASLEAAYEDPSQPYTEWHREWKDKRDNEPGLGKPPPPPPPGHLGVFKVFGDDGGDLTVELLVTLVFASPPQLEPVLSLAIRMASADPLNPMPMDPMPISDLLEGLCEGHRGNAWSALWLLASTERLWSLGFAQEMPGSVAVVDLARESLMDARETVRVEAAWVLALASKLTLADIRALHASTSSLTEPGLAAVAGYAAASKKGASAQKIERVRAAIVAKRPVNEAAASWGKSRFASTVSTPSAGASQLGSGTSPEQVEGGTNAKSSNILSSTDNTAPPSAPETASQDVDLGSTHGGLLDSSTTSGEWKDTNTGAADDDF